MIEGWHDTVICNQTGEEVTPTIWQEQNVSFKYTVRVGFPEPDAPYFDYETLDEIDNYYGDTIDTEYNCRACGDANFDPTTHWRPVGEVPAPPVAPATHGARL